MRIIGLAGSPGSGKTTLMIGLVAELTRRGLAVSAIENAHPSFDIDQPGKDSYRHRAAGAVEVMVASAKRWALIRGRDGEAGATIADLLPRLAPVDLLIVDGFAGGHHAKIEVHRPANGRAPLCRQDPTIVAVASDAPLDGLAVPVLDLGDVGAIADFIVGHCRLEAA